MAPYKRSIDHTSLCMLIASSGSGGEFKKQFTVCIINYKNTAYQRKMVTN